MRKRGSAWGRGPRLRGVFARSVWTNGGKLRQFPVLFNWSKRATRYEKHFQDMIQRGMEGIATEVRLSNGAAAALSPDVRAEVTDAGSEGVAVGAATLTSKTPEETAVCVEAGSLAKVDVNLLKFLTTDRADRGSDRPSSGAETEVAGRGGIGDLSRAAN